MGNFAILQSPSFELNTSGVRSESLTTIVAQEVGTTRSLKAIRQPTDIDNKTLAELTVAYGPDDHFDAYAVFQYLISREMQSNNANNDNSDRIPIYNRISIFHESKLGRHEMKHQKEVLKLTTIFDVINFGYSRSHAFLVNERPLRIE